MLGLLLPPFRLLQLPVQLRELALRGLAALVGRALGELVPHPEDCGSAAAARGGGTQRHAHGTCGFKTTSVCARGWLYRRVPDRRVPDLRDWDRLTFC